MKTEMKLLLRLLTPLALFSAPHLASAYYDPGLQRWINRDPITEAGGNNLYLFGGGEPGSWSDPWGLSVWKCTRPSSFAAGALHAYLWDDRQGQKDPSCGMQTSRGKPGPTSNPRDRGPIAGTQPIQSPWQQGDYTCIRIPDTDGEEDTIMTHCRDCINAKVNVFAPGLNDCHDACDAVLRDLGLDAPPMSRAKDPPPWHVPPGQPGPGRRW
jgi:hypothetical protein